MPDIKLGDRFRIVRYRPSAQYRWNGVYMALSGPVSGQAIGQDRGPWVMFLDPRDMTESYAEIWAIDIIERAPEPKPRIPSSPERNAAIYFKRLQGRTYRQIGEQYGLTAGTVSDIFEKEQRRRRQWIRKHAWQARVLDPDETNYRGVTYKFTPESTYREITVNG